MFGKKRKLPEDTLTSGDVAEVLKDEASGVWKKVKAWTGRQWMKVPKKGRVGTYILAGVLAVGFTGVMLMERDKVPVKQKDGTVEMVGTPTWRAWGGCIWEAWETGRKTKYSMINNICYIESLTSTPEKTIWIRSSNDRGFGEGDGE